MRLEELDFSFPEELIAQQPADPRDSCRLLVVDKNEGVLEHRVFSDLPELLRRDDLLVINDSRVLPARLFARKESGGKVELLFLHELDPQENPSTGRDQADWAEVWEVLARPSARLREGGHLLLDGGLRVDLVERLGEGRWRLRLPAGMEGVRLLERLGSMPLPPYIKSELRRLSDYQTVFAETPGSAAAPTAGLHFTPGLLARLGEAGIETARVTLHVGLDTFRPVTAPVVEDHTIHREHYSVLPSELARLDQARAQSRRVVAVGTTSVRVLETIYGQNSGGGAANRPTHGHTSIFITPGYRFRAVDALITNFHLPRTSLLALVMAFAGTELVRLAYQRAIEEHYRFFSFGDAMLVQEGGR